MYSVITIITYNIVHVPVTRRPSVAGAAAGLSGGSIGPLGLTGPGLGGKRGGPEFLLLGGREVGRGGGGFLGGDEATGIPAIKDENTMSDWSVMV